MKLAILKSKCIGTIFSFLSCLMKTKIAMKISDWASQIESIYVLTLNTKGKTTVFLDPR